MKDPDASSARATSRVTVVDDHLLVSHTLASSLQRRGHTVTLVDPRDPGLLEVVLATQPDVALLDLGLDEAPGHVDAGLGGVDLVTPLTTAGIAVIVVTAVHDPVPLARCVVDGAAGIFSKSRSFDELMDLVDAVLTSGPVVTEGQRRTAEARLREHARQSRQRLAPFEALTKREAAVLAALMEGHSVASIAEQSVVSENTVRSQVRGVLVKLGAKSQLEAVAHARTVGWTPPARD